jgi:hypothetical protein
MTKAPGARIARRLGMIAGVLVCAPAYASHNFGELFEFFWAGVALGFVLPPVIAGAGNRLLSLAMSIVMFALCWAYISFLATSFDAFTAVAIVFVVANIVTAVVLRRLRVRKL